ncbi:hypothetical protein CCMSSC00406_0002668 [Pleurotus cornucopiae]|uniref:Uncharacterized protein n=1 Tax=Pleurotus cornucopiae TaxID=5321 RepID=A0ACB7IXI3_PLECO|nr:hypothetical protein CCMSSC00406_0002668 [Pleurotus cornucopiae]
MISNRSLTTSYNNTTPRVAIERNHPVPKHPSNPPPSSTMKPSHYETHTHSSYQYYPSEYQCCQDYQYAVPANPQIHSCMYSTYHAAPCFTASASHTGTFTSPSSSFAASTGGQCNSRDPYNKNWDTSMHDAVSPHVLPQRCSVSPAESSDSDLSCMAQDEQQPSSATDITYRTFITYMPPSSADSNDVPMSDPFSRQQYPSHNLHHVSAASHSQANSTTSSSRLDYDSSIGSALSHQPTPGTPPALVFKEPITLHHPRPRRLFLNRLLTETIPFDEEPVIQSCKAPEGVQKQPLSPNSLLCQPAPPSVMFPAGAGVNGSCLPDVAFQDSTSCSNFPYDHNELAQNAVVCTCGCMGSYYMTH